MVGGAGWVRSWVTPDWSLVSMVYTWEPSGSVQLYFLISDMVVRLEANSGMYIFHTFFYRSDAKRLQMY